MYYKKQADENGECVDEKGVRFNLFYATSPAEKWQHLWTYFDTLDECLAEWHLTYDPQPEPQPEN